MHAVDHDFGNRRNPRPATTAPTAAASAIPADWNWPDMSVVITTTDRPALPVPRARDARLAVVTTQAYLNLATDHELRIAAATLELAEHLDPACCARPTPWAAARGDAHPGMPMSGRCLELPALGDQQVYGWLPALGLIRLLALERPGLQVAWDPGGGSLVLLDGPATVDDAVDTVCRRSLAELAPGGVLPGVDAAFPPEDPSPLVSSVHRVLEPHRAVLRPKGTIRTREPLPSGVALLTLPLGDLGCKQGTQKRCAACIFNRLC